MEILKAKIAFSGGGTGGSVTPLIAIFEELMEREGVPVGNFVWFGSKAGLEKPLVEKTGMAYIGISSGKLRRYFSWQNLLDPFKILAGCFEALFWLIKAQPDIILTAGSFVAVPVAAAGWLLRIPVIVHQMDIRPGLANKLMAPFAKIVTTTFEKSLLDYGSKAVRIGNPVRQEIKQARVIDKEPLYKKYGLRLGVPVVLVVGGGTGASAINDLVFEARDDLGRVCQVLHQTGIGKGRGVSSGWYKTFEFLGADKLKECYALADVVISRAGLGFITEFAYLAKPAILIPIPNNHQEENAQLLKENEAAIVVDQEELTAELLTSIVTKLLGEPAVLSELGRNISELIPSGAEGRMIEIVKRIID